MADTINIIVEEQLHQVVEVLIPGPQGLRGNPIVFTFETPLLQWQIAHNLNKTEILFQVFETDNRLVYPMSIVFVDSNNIVIYFTEATAGKVIIS